MVNVLTRTDKTALIASYAEKPEQIVNLLCELQQASPQHYIDHSTAELIREQLRIPVSRLYELCSYYPLINVEPQAKYVLKFCNAAPCILANGDLVRTTLQEVLDVPEDTVTSDGLFAYKGVPALGACDQEPFIKVGTKVFGNLDAAKIKQLINDLHAGNYDGEL